MYKIHLQVIYCHLIVEMGIITDSETEHTSHIILQMLLMLLNALGKNCASNSKVHLLKAAYGFEFLGCLKVDELLQIIQRI